jgi:restriction system protein
MLFLESHPLLAAAFVLLAVFMALGAPRRRRGSRSASRGRRVVRTSASAPTASKRRRTNLVTDEEWQAFREVKAGITGQKGETAVARQLAFLGAPTLHDVILADSRGLTQVDHLVLGPDAILVLETKTYSGFITGGLHSREWTQHLGQGSTRTSLQNPIRQNHRHRSAASEIIGNADVPVLGYVVSAGKARFCDELVGVVVELPNLPSILMAGDRRQADQAALRAAWDCLRAAAQAGEARRAEHLADIRAKHGMAA